MSISPQQSLAAIAGWENAVVEELQGGHNNQTWLVTAGSRRGILKIDTSPRELPYNTRLAERQVQSSAAEAGIASPVIYASDNTYLAEYAPGEVWSVADLDNRENLFQLADLLRKLHALPLTGRVMNTAAAATFYCRTIARARSATAQHCLGIVHSAPVPDKLRCCHNDLVAENIIATPQLRLLDWEYACDNDPLFDLATVIAHHDLSPGHSACLLGRYFDGDGERWQPELEEQLRFYNALTWLWYASQAEPDPGQLAVFESRLG